MEKFFNVTREGCNIRCKLYCNVPREIQKIVLFGHGFGGHKDNKAAERFAHKVLSKGTKLGVVTFDWPAHGEDARKKLELSDCMTYLRLVLQYIREDLGVEDISGYATSFGGYLFLKYLSEQGNPFRKLVLRCPAVPMHQVLSGAIMTEDIQEKLQKGKEVLVGFDRKVRMDRHFLEELEACDIRSREYFDWAEDILILHGTADTVVPMEQVQAFAENNCIEFEAVEGADHRFRNEALMDAAIARMIKFLQL